MADDAARILLRSAAPGQFDAVAESLQKLGKQTLSSSSGSKWLTEVRDEHEKFQCIGIHQKDLKHALAEPLMTAAKQYQKEMFGSKSGVTARVALMAGTSNQQLLVHTYAEKIDAPNQHSGCWRATWTIDKVSGDDACEISGNVQVNGYAYEDGNVQLKITKDFAPKKVGKASSKDGEAPSLQGGIVQQIMQWELEILGIMESLNESVTADQLRSIRRVLPITKTKMKWDVVAHRSVKTLKKTAPETRSKVKYVS